MRLGILRPGLMCISMEKNERIFADTNFFVALFHPADALHQDARRIATACSAASALLVISNFIFLETVTVLSQRRGKDIAIAAGNYLLYNPFIEMVHVDEALQRETWSIFRNASAKNISFVDASILAILKMETITTLLTFDHKDFSALQKQHRFRFYVQKNNA